MKKIIAYTDGGSRGNPGPSAVGVVFCNEKGQIFKKCSEYIGDDCTNNDAEYQALIFALQKFKALFGKKLAKSTEIQIRSDSELMIKQLNGQYKITEPKIQAFFITVWNLKFDFKNIKFRHIPRRKNTEADALVNEELDNRKKNQKLLKI